MDLAPNKIKRNTNYFVFLLIFCLEWYARVLSLQSCHCAAGVRSASQEELLSESLEIAFDRRLGIGDSFLWGPKLKHERGRGPKTKDVVILVRNQGLSQLDQNYMW